MGTLLVIILFVVIFWPILKMAWRIFVQARRINRFMNDPTSFFTGYDGQTAGKTRRQEPEKQNRSKKFTRDMGEYVEFTDVACNVGDRTDSAGEIKYKQEEQVTDIEWVDIEEERK